MARHKKDAQDGIKAALDALTGVETLKAEQDAQVIEDTRTALDKGVKKLKKRAETVEEFKEKYGKKRFTSSTAWRIVLYNYVYAAYQIEEGAKTGEIQKLYNSSLKKGGVHPSKDVIARISTNEDMLRYNAFVHLQEWTENAFKTAVFMRNALKSVIADYYNITASIIAAEELAKVLGSKAEEPKVSLWLSTLTLDNYAPQTHGAGINALRRNITLALRYLKAYNTFIEMVAAAVDMPEYTVFKVNTQNTNNGLLELNEALSALVSLTNENREAEAEYLKETLKAFDPIEIEPEPIPEGNIKKADAIISVLCRQGFKTWTSAFSALYAGYWRQA